MKHNRIEIIFSITHLTHFVLKVRIMKGSLSANWGLIVPKPLLLLTY